MNGDELFEALKSRHLLDICIECGDGDDNHPIGEDGMCVRHGGWSPNAAKEELMNIVYPTTTITFS